MRILIYIFLANLAKSQNIFENLTELPEIIKKSPKIQKDFVKLTMKQGLVMNQVLNTYAIDQKQNVECKIQTDEFKDALRKFEPWALKMFDSSSKLQSGILLGNLMDFGSYDQCVQIDQNTSIGQIQGKYCTIRIIPTLNLIKKILKFRNIDENRFSKVEIIVENTMLQWSVCIPASCPTEVILEHFNKSIQDLGTGLNLKVELEDYDCMAKSDNPKIEIAQIISLSFLGFFISISLISTIIDLRHDTKARNKIVDAFSILINYRRIMSKGRPSDLDCLHGLRFLSTMYVIMGHRFLMSMFYPVVNSLEILDWIITYFSTIIIGGTICVDSFFLISGILVSYGFFDHVSKNNSFSLMKFYAYRYFRITPALGIVVLFYSTLLQFFGSGPLWMKTVKAHQLPCQYFWWSTLLHIQNYVNPGALCIIQIWYLTCEMIYYYLSPIIMYPLWKWSRMGKIIYIFFYLLSVSISFYLSWINEYRGGMPVTNQLLQTEYFKKHYIAPHTRAPPYIMGLGVGYFIFRTRDIKVKMNKIANICGWIMAFTMMITVVVGCLSFQQADHDYNRLESSMYIALSRSAWTLGLIWIIWACLKGYGGIVNYFLSSHLFRVLGRISYGMFLLHMIFQYLKCGALRVPMHFSNFDQIYETAADWLVVILIGFLFTIFFELPLVKLQAMFFDFKARNKIRSDMK